MRSPLALILILFLFFIMSSVYGQEQPIKNLKRVEWLLGRWDRMDVKPGQTAFESWSKISNEKFSGVGVMMNGRDTVFTEKLALLVQDNAIYYVADVAANKSATYFKLTRITRKGFVCENPMHDFPKKIDYQLRGNQLKAVVSGNGRAINFAFKKSEQAG